MSTALPRVYLLDVEGTIAPISLVSEQLFPYARAHFEQFLWKALEAPEQEFSEGSVFWDLMLLQMENEAEEDPGAPRVLPDIANQPGFAGNPKTVSMSPAYGIPRILNYIFWLMDRDRKSTALKSLQGKIWKAGFEGGELQGTLFADVPAALTRWAARGQVAIYSSGSVEAQRLLFRHSIFGDLTGLIVGYFDTRTGAKTDRASYAAIAAQMGVAPEEVLFFSDVVRELDAARDAGCQTRLVVREGNAPVEAAHEHTVIDSLEDVQ
ncbi:MAG TPA: acireductone synthase [Terracidiphilus sp.]|nr:acireductone synthase [Terracidiphilus sp.]